MRRPGSLVCVLATAAALAWPGAAGALDPGAIDGCHQAILKGQAAVSRGRIAVVSRCLKTLNYQTCMDTDQHAIAHENELRNWVAGEDSACRAAIDAGSAVSDFGPASCSDEWADCDTEIPAITTLEDLAECLVCQERGLDFEFRDTIGLPRPTPGDLDERRCTRRIARLVSYAARKNVYDAAVCAQGGMKPFACPVDPTDESRFGRALATFARNITMCGIDEGKAPGALANLCGGSATDTATLTACFTAVAKCIACRRANSALGQSEDCIAFSGFADCDGMF